jgi:hypothetical protein
MKDEEILASYTDTFTSHNMSDADPFENSATVFTLWFTKLTYPFIQPHFDACFAVVHSIASHYRPSVQKCGAACLYKLVSDAAPAQIRTISVPLLECLNKLVQIGHAEVLVEVVPVITRASPLIFAHGAVTEFHVLFANCLETWNREATDAATSFEWAKWFGEMISFLGMCAGRYMRAGLSIIDKRLRSCKQRLHILQYVGAVEAMCEAALPVIRANAAEILGILQKARANGAEFVDVAKPCGRVEGWLNRALKPPVFCESE